MASAATPSKPESITFRFLSAAGPLLGGVSRLRPGSNLNGIDDLLAAWGPERVLELFNRSEPAAASEAEPSQSQELIRLCEDVELFPTPEGEAYAHVRFGEHRETWMLRSKGFSRWLARQFHASGGKPPRAQALQEALGLLEAKAQFEAPEMPVWVRVAGYGDRIYIDLCNSDWETIEISPAGWRVVSDVPVRFRRTRGMRSLPRPVSDGSVAVLRKLINIGDDENWILCLSWLVAALRPIRSCCFMGSRGQRKAQWRGFSGESSILSWRRSGRLLEVIEIC